MVISVTGTRSVNIDKQLWQIEDQPAPKPPTVHKPPVVQATLPVPPTTTKARCSTNMYNKIQYIRCKIQYKHLPLQLRYQIQYNHLPSSQIPNPVQQLQIQIQQGQPQLNWSYFKPEFSGKPEEDAEAHILRTNDWMETHNFPEVAKVQRFCLTLTREARLWYESLRPIIVD